jgi:hypothetical protein
MDLRKKIKNDRDMLDGNLNRMTVTEDLDELVNRYRYAKLNLEQIYLSNFKRISNVRSLKEVSGRD